MTPLLESPAPKLDGDMQERFESLLYCPFMKQFSQVMQASKASATSEEYSPDVEIELSQIRAQAVTQATANLAWPSVPAIVEQLDSVLSSPEVCAADIAEVVMMDVGITARLLSLVNSAVYNLPREIESVEQAVALLGSDKVRNAALAVSVITTFSKNDVDGFDSQSFWQHSLAVATCSRFLGNVLRDRGDDSPDPGKLFLAGLMHDIGRVVIVQQLPDYFQHIRSAVNDGEMSLLDAEHSVLGKGHTDLGAELLTGWKMDSEIFGATRNHHAPSLDDTFACLVHCADVIAHGLGYSLEQTPVPRTDPAVWEKLEFTNESIRAIGTKLIEQMDILTAAILT